MENISLNRATPVGGLGRGEKLAKLQKAALWPGGGRLGKLALFSF
jgi:hypothetical protein